MNEYVAVALSALGLFVSSYLVYVVQRHDTATAEWRKGIEGTLERLRNKDSNLGYDIQATRSAMAYLCGQLGKGAPVYERQNGGNGG